MQARNLPPMAGGSHDHREVICIEAKRICDFCFQEHRVERTFPTTTTGTGLTAQCAIDEANVVCRVVQRREVDDKKNKELVCLAIEVPVTIRIVDATGMVVQTLTERVIFLKQAVLCVPGGVDVECEVTGDCCCFIDVVSGQISCTFDFCVIIQSKITVRVLVETMGECEARRCKSTILGCPPKVPKACVDCNDDSGDC